MECVQSISETLKIDFSIVLDDLFETWTVCAVYFSEYKFQLLFLPLIALIEDTFVVKSEKKEEKSIFNRLLDKPKTFVTWIVNETRF